MLDLKGPSAAGRDSIMSRKSAMPGSGSAPIPDVPVLQGLTVKELLQAHTQPGAGGKPSILAEMQRSLEENTGAEGAASLSQRLQQVSYGYHHGLKSVTLVAKPAAPEPGKLRVGGLQ